MYFKMLAFLFLPFAIEFSGAVYADEGKSHAHKAPHGGVIQETEEMHTEFLIDKSGAPKMFLYDKVMKPLERNDLQARLTVKAHDGTQHTRELKFSKDPKEGALFKGEPIKGLTDWEQAVVSLKIKDSWSHLKFSHH